ncbi:hypothetical protein UY3_00222 [Chelonia mydas]|uniref:Uncharacterized protein n=1 Tax=Chelonia mydas TaxID=8469 RepID=M7CMN5_CHEMY|nr:hypothetical protein UY3_00222 [Chelonia mydas]
MDASSARLYLLNHCHIWLQVATTGIRGHHVIGDTEQNEPGLVKSFQMLIFPVVKYNDSSSQQDAFGSELFPGGGGGEVKGLEGTPQEGIPKRLHQQVLLRCVATWSCSVTSVLLVLA